MYVHDLHGNNESWKNRCQLLVGIPINDGVYWTAADHATHTDSFRQTPANDRRGYRSMLVCLTCTNHTIHIDNVRQACAEDRKWIQIRDDTPEPTVSAIPVAQVHFNHFVPSSDEYYWLCPSTCEWSVGIRINQDKRVRIVSIPSISLDDDHVRNKTLKYR